MSEENANIKKGFGISVLQLVTLLVIQWLCYILLKKLRMKEQGMSFPYHLKRRMVYSNTPNIFIPLQNEGCKRDLLAKSMLWMRFGK